MPSEKYTITILINGQKWHSSISQQPLRTLAEQHPLTVPFICEGREWTSSRRRISFYLLFSRNLFFHFHFPAYFFLSLRWKSFPVKSDMLVIENKIISTYWNASQTHRKKWDRVPSNSFFTQDVYVQCEYVGNELATVNMSEALAQEFRVTRELVSSPKLLIVSENEKSESEIEKYNSLQ